MPVRRTWKADEVKRKMRAARTRGLKLGAEHLLGAARERVPIEEATLERSGVASVDGPTGKAAVSFSTPYAVRQHEELDYRHDPGRTAKYLEIPMHTEAKVIAAILAAQLRRAMRS